jgi:hypothetical protein
MLAVNRTRLELRRLPWLSTNRVFVIDQHALKSFQGRKYETLRNRFSCNGHAGMHCEYKRVTRPFFNEEAIVNTLELKQNAP